MAKKNSYLFVAIIGIAVVSGAAWWYQSKPSGPTEIGASGAPASPTTGASGAGPAAGGPPRAAGVEVAKVETMRMQDDAQTVGSLRSRQNVMMRPEVPGRVKEVGFQDGARVRLGQVLVQLDDTLQRADVRQTQAQVAIAAANLKRNQELVAQNFVAQRVLEESAASLQVAEAQLGLSCARLSRMVIVAPFDGTVGIRNINVGDFVKDGADLVNIEDASSMYVDFRLPERFQGKLKLQQSVDLTLDAFPNRSFKARIEAIDPLLDVNGRSVGVRAVLPNTLGEVALPPAGRPGGPGGVGGPGAPGAAGAAGAPGAKPAASGNSPGPAKAGPAQANAKPEMKPEMKPGAKPGAAAGGARFVSGADLAGCPPMALPVAMPISPGLAQIGKPPGPSGPPGPMPLRSGMFARVNTVFSINDAALVVPEEAIVPQGGRQFVIKVVELSALPPAVAASAPAMPPDTKFVSLRQEVKLGARRQGKVEVVDGLTEGQTVVVAGQQRLQRDGTGLRIVEAGRPPQGAASGAPAPAPAPAASR